jgi:ribosomal protein L2
MAICRSNKCGFYNADNDACQILRDRGKAGRVVYLLQHPNTRCVAENPLF